MALRSRTFSLVGLLVLPFLELNGCPGAQYGNLACPELSGGGGTANFAGDPKANATIHAFVQASGELSTLAAQIEEEVAAACINIGRDLGVSESAMAAKSGPGGKAAGACDAAAAKIDAILKAGANAQLTSHVTPPHCTAAADAYASCAGECKANVDPGYIVAHCEPARLSGHCDGRCEGSCDGTCHGTCNGTCTAKDASGNCAGACKGTCEGQCDATCHAKCEGTWKAPRCEANVKGPSVDAKCDASCKAHADFRAQCTPAEVDVKASVNAGEMPKLVATLKANLPTLVRAEVAYGHRLVKTLQTMVDVGADMPNAIADASAKGGACMTAAANAAVSARASISVSVQASASVTGRAHAGG